MCENITVNWKKLFKDANEQNERLKYKLGIITKSNADLERKVAELEKRLKEQGYGKKNY